MFDLTITRSATPLPYPVTGSGVEVWRDLNGVITAYGEIRREHCWMHLPGIASFRLPRDGSENCVAFTNGIEEALIVEAYRRHVLPMALHSTGWEVIHASGVHRGRGVIAFCAPSETGKSTIACALGCRGYTLWADDALAFAPSANGIATTSLPFEMRLRSSAAKLLSDCHKNGSSTGNGHEAVEQTLTPLLAICVLRRTTNGDRPVSIRQLYSGNALEAVLPNAWCFTLRDVERKRRMMNSYLHLIARTAILDVCFQAGLENLPIILDAIEDRLEHLLRVESVLPNH